MKKVMGESAINLEVKKSKFMAFLIPFENFKTKMEQLKLAHPKARHFVYAYRFLNEQEQIVENQSDDGEPKGSSGKPALNVLRGQEIINAAVIIVRYFGGTKLGVGGLVRAYSDSVNQVLKISKLVDYKKRVSKSIKVGYKVVSMIEHVLKQYPNTTFDKKFEEKNVEICFNVDEEFLDQILIRIKEYFY